MGHGHDHLGATVFEVRQERHNIVIFCLGCVKTDEQCLFTINLNFLEPVDIKFNKIYMTRSELEAMQMTNIYLNKEQYDTKQENAEKITIKINL